MKMNTDFRDMGHPLTLSTPESGNSYTMSEVELDSPTDIDYNSFTMNSSPSKPIISVARRNERERKRVRLVNQGFAILRDRVPRDRCNRGRRSSKVETLRSAILYIRQLQQLLLESQIRYQDHEMTSCYSYIGDDSYLNPTASSICDSYSSNHGYSEEIFQNSTIPSLRTNSGVQNSNQGYDRHLSVPWFTYNN